jgi:hypothetical protein
MTASRAARRSAVLREMSAGYNFNSLQPLQSTSLRTDAMFPSALTINRDAPGISVRRRRGRKRGHILRSFIGLPHALRPDRIR